MSICIRTSTLENRFQYGRLLSEKGLHGTAVEIGTHQGEFARALLSAWKPGVLHCIDPWTMSDDPRQNNLLPDKQDSRQSDLLICQRNLAKFINVRRAKLIQTTSMEAVNNYSNGSLDFVYIDGDHRNQFVSKDLAHWWVRLKPGGVLAGHDFVCPNEKGGGWGREVFSVIVNFAISINHDIYVIPEPGSPWSYHFIKGLKTEDAEHV